jgi:hypothetical protein
VEVIHRRRLLRPAERDYEGQEGYGGLDVSEQGGGVNDCAFLLGAAFLPSWGSAFPGGASPRGEWESGVKDGGAREGCGSAPPDRSERRPLPRLIPDTSLFGEKVGKTASVGRNPA